MATGLHRFVQGSAVLLAGVTLLAATGLQAASAAASPAPAPVHRLNCVRVSGHLYLGDPGATTNPAFVVCNIHVRQVHPRSDGVIVVLRQARHLSVYSLLKSHFTVPPFGRSAAALAQSSGTGENRLRAGRRAAAPRQHGAPAAHEGNLLHALLPAEPGGRRRGCHSPHRASQLQVLSRRADAPPPGHRHHADPLDQLTAAGPGHAFAVVPDGAPADAVAAALWCLAWARFPRNWPAIRTG